MAISHGRMMRGKCDDGGMDTHLLALYVAAVFLAMIAPGPDMMFILATGMRGGAPGRDCWPPSAWCPARSCR